MATMTSQRIIVSATTRIVISSPRPPFSAPTPTPQSTAHARGTCPILAKRHHGRTGSRARARFSRWLARTPSRPPRPQDRPISDQVRAGVTSHFGQRLVLFRATPLRRASAGLASHCAHEHDWRGVHHGGYQARFQRTRRPARQPWRSFGRQRQSITEEGNTMIAAIDARKSADREEATMTPLRPLAGSLQGGIDGRHRLRRVRDGQGAEP